MLKQGLLPAGQFGQGSHFKIHLEQGVTPQPFLFSPRGWSFKSGGEALPYHIFKWDSPRVSSITQKPGKYALFSRWGLKYSLLWENSWVPLNLSVCKICQTQCPANFEMMW